MMRNTMVNEGTSCKKETKKKGKEKTNNKKIDIPNKHHEILLLVLYGELDRTQVKMFLCGRRDLS